MNQATLQFIEQHLRDDVIQLQLRKRSAAESTVDMSLALRQIAGRQKIRIKVPEWYSRTDLLYPPILSLEQSSSFITAKYKATLLKGDKFVDLTGGFGIDFAHIAPQFSKAIYVERNANLCELARHNFEMLGLADYEIYNSDAELFIKELESTDCILIDPHRRSSAGNKTVLIADCEPNVIAMAKDILQKSSHVLIKLSPMLDISQALRDLQDTFAVHVIAVENECKEILLELKAENLPEQRWIHTVNFRKNAPAEEFRFTMEEEAEIVPLFSSKLSGYLYEPNAAVMKSGAFKTISVKYQVGKINSNTHLYASAELRSGFPGRCFEIIDVFDHSKSALRQISQQYPQANITVRNFPLSVAEFRKKTGIREGGDHYLFAMRAKDNQLCIVVGRKI